MKNMKLKIILLVVSILFVIWNIVWGINFSLYNKYITTNYEKFVKSYGKNVSGYNYTVKKPSYFSLKGNFAISNKEDTLSIIIWPDLFITGEYEYGLIIYDEKTEHGYIFYVDDNLNYLSIPKNNFSDEETKIINKLLIEYKDELKRLYNLAKAEWVLG